MEGAAALAVKAAVATELATISPLKAAALRVVVVESVRAAVYSVEEIVGSLLSVVYLIVAPAVFVARVTFRVPLNVAPFGVMVGVST